MWNGTPHSVQLYYWEVIHHGALTRGFHTAFGQRIAHSHDSSSPIVKLYANPSTISCMVT